VSTRSDGDALVPPALPAGTLAETANGVPETDDVFLGGRLRILQPTTGYRAGLDAVLLAAAVADAATAAALPCHILDAGSGVGVVGLCIARRLPLGEVTLVERQPQLVALAERNVSRNDLMDRVRVVRVDLLDPEAVHGAAGLASNSFDVVVANPPYLDEGTGRPAIDPLKRGASAMPAGDLDQWARFLVRMAAPSGKLAMIHRADALGRLLSVLDGRFGALELLPIHPRLGAPANRVIVRGRKGSRAPLTIHPGLVLHADDGRFTPALEAILRGGAELAWHSASPD
jgi:tRNA1(Val) A37 N6-methylase TrmN6